ncbi:hypothetical protein [Endozoicomonas atrinae]|uniref:hypothetical protein n=1 Tax=Endozoicomonas atrinae TaxID=1333660 RepID=UPI003AFFC3C1
MDIDIYSATGRPPSPYPQKKTVDSAQDIDNQVQTCFGHDARMLSEGMEYVTLLTQAKGACPPMQRRHLSEFLVAQYNTPDDLPESQIVLAENQPEIKPQAVSPPAQEYDPELLFSLKNDPAILNALNRKGNLKKSVSTDKIKQELKGLLEGNKYKEFKIELKNLPDYHLTSAILEVNTLNPLPHIV